MATEMSKAPGTEVAAQVKEEAAGAKYIPPAFAHEPFASLSNGPALFQHDVLEILRISATEFEALRAEGYLKPVGTPCLALYGRKKVVAFAFGLSTNALLAETVAFVIGRRDPAWASETTRHASPPGLYSYDHPDHPINEKS